MRRNGSLRLKQLATAVALLGALIFAPGPAHAEDDVTLSMARERFKEGVAYFDKKDFAKARVAFLQAYALKKHPAVLLNLAQSELRSSHEADAAKHFSQYLREHKEATDAERQSAETGLSAAKALVGEADLDVDTIGAEIYVDGDLEGSTPLAGPIFLMPGTHEIQARKNGESTSGSVTAVAGQATSLSLKLSGRPSARSSSAAQPATSEIETSTEEPTSDSTSTKRQAFGSWLVSKPGAIVGASIAGAGLIGAGAFAIASKVSYDAADSIAEGISSHAVDVDMKTTGSSGACVNPANWLANQTAPLPDGSPRFADQAAVQARAQEYKDNCNKYSHDLKLGDRYKKVAFVSLAVGGAAAVGTLIYYFVDTAGSKRASRDSDRRIVLLPIVQGGFAGGLVAGRF